VAEQDVEIVKRICELHAQGDYKGAAKLIHKKTAWHHHHGFDDYPDVRTYRNYKAIIGYLREFWEAWDEFTITPREFVDAGEERIVALLSLHARGRGSGIVMERLFAEIWTVRKGKAIDYQLYRYPNQALASVGIERRVTD
jgi:ketosteroid isomerase-like protein